MRPSISSSFLREWDAQAMVRCFAEHGWRAVELHDIHGQLLLSTGRPDRVGNAFRKYAADYGISFPQGHLLVARGTDGPGHPMWFDTVPAEAPAWAQAMDEMRRWIDFFGALGVRAGVLHIGGFTLRQLGWSQERIMARRIETLAAMADYAQGGPTVICLENLSAPHGIETVSELLTIVSAVNSDRAALCLDMGHANLAGVNIRDYIMMAGSRLKALHVADNSGHSDDHLFPYGGGTIRWEEVLQALGASGYDGPLNLEVPGENRCPEPVRMAKLDYALRLAEAMIARCEESRSMP